MTLAPVTCAPPGVGALEARLTGGRGGGGLGLGGRGSCTTRPILWRVQGFGQAHAPAALGAAYPPLCRVTVAPPHSPGHASDRGGVPADRVPQRGWAPDDEEGRRAGHSPTIGMAPLVCTRPHGGRASPPCQLPCPPDIIHGYGVSVDLEPPASPPNMKQFQNGISPSPSVCLR